MNEQHLGSSLDDFLIEDGRLAEAESMAVKRVLAFQISKLMAEQRLSKAEMARRMRTSRVHLTSAAGSVEREDNRAAGAGDVHR